MDPDDTRVLDDVVRFVGQKVAAVIAKSEAIAEEGCRRLKVDYEILLHVVDSAAAIAPGAPLTHPDKMPEHRVVNSARNIVAESHGEYGDVAAALSASAITWEGTFTTQRVHHAALGTHGGFAFIDGEGVLTVRSSTQARPVLWQPRSPRKILRPRSRRLPPAPWESMPARVCWIRMPLSAAAGLCRLH